MRYLISCLLLLFVLTACRKVPPPFYDQSPDERVNAALDGYGQLLTGAPHGWKAYVYPVGVGVDSAGIGGFTFYMQFGTDNRVTMLSDFDQQTATVPRESSYRLKALQQPTLLFDTYSYIHTIADPNPSVSYGWYGRGWASDFELAFTEVRQDTILLTGRFNRSRVLLIKATQQEKEAFLAGMLGETMANTSGYRDANPFLYFEGNGSVKIGVDIDYDYLLVRFSFINEAGQLQTLNAPFSHTLQGLHFKYPVYMGGYTFQDLYWDAEKEIYYIQHHVMAAILRISLANAPGPIIPLWKVLGSKYTSLIVPVTPLQGQSARFATRYAAVKNGVKTGGYNLDLGDLTFAFNGTAGTMTLTSIMRQGTSPYTFSWNYAYTVGDNGIYRFTRTGQNGNAGLVEASMRPLLASLENESFRVEYFTAGSQTLGQLTSVEDPDFYFTGSLR